MILSGNDRFDGRMCSLRESSQILAQLATIGGTRYLHFLLFVSKWMAPMISSTSGHSFLLSGAIVLCVPNIAVSAVALRTVALSGQPAPGAPAGTNFRHFNDPPVINSLGHTGFKGALTDGSMANLGNGIWFESNGTIQLVAGVGVQGPNAPTGVDPPALNAAGQSAFYGVRGDGSGNVNSGAWIEQSGNLELIALAGHPAPGTSSGVTFRALINGLVLLNAAGHTAFKSSLAGDGIDQTNDIGLWSTSFGSLALVARDGDQAPGASPGVLFSFLSEPTLNDAGTVAFSAATNGTGPQVSLGIWSGTPGNLQLVVHNVADVPGMSSGVRFSGFNEPAINVSGQIAFSAGLTGNGVDNTNNRSIWVNGSNGLELVVRSGSQAPGAANGVMFAGFVPPVINAAGQTAFQASLTGSGVDDTNSAGMWFGTVGQVELVARAGSQAPGTPSAATFDDFGTPTLNAAGQLAFFANLFHPSPPRGQPPTPGPGGVDATNDVGIWATDLNGALQLIVREGDLLEVAPNDFRTVSSLDFADNTGNGDGRHSGFNDLGQITFAAFFADGSSGVFVSNLVAVPEPGAAVMLAVLAIGILRGRDARRRAPTLTSTLAPGACD
jgi:uncharacterized cupin superfamily protein